MSAWLGASSPIGGPPLEILRMYAHYGTWATRPDVSGMADGTRVFITDIGANGGSEWRVASGILRLAAPTLLRSPAPATGIASAGTDQYFPLISVPQSVLRHLRWFELMAIMSKSGVAGNVSTQLLEGLTGTVSDTLFLNTGIWTAANLTVNVGDVRRWDAVGLRFHRFASIQNAHRLTGNITASAFLVNGQGPTGLVDQNVIYTIRLNCAAADIPTVHAFDLMGY